MTCLLSENFYNLRQFPNHTLSTKEGGSTPTPANGQSGYEVHRVANARRHSRDYYTPTAANSNADLDVTCDRVRAADMLVLDRNSNLAGETVRLWASSESDFGTYEEFTFTVPSKTYTGNYASDGHPVRTDEGAIIYRFAQTSAKYWRLRVDAMGANERPRVGGVWLGKSWQPQITRMPWDDEPKWLDQPSARNGSPTGYLQTGRQNQVQLMLRDETEWATAKWVIHSLFWQGHTMWYTSELGHAERSWLAYAPSGSYAAPQAAGRRGRDLALAMVEYQQVLL